MGEQKHIGPGLMAEDLISIRPDRFELTFPEALNISSIVLPIRPRIMKVKEWLNWKKRRFLITDDMLSRYSEKKINPAFYGVIKIDGIC